MSETNIRQSNTDFSTSTFRGIPPLNFIVKSINDAKSKALAKPNTKYYMRGGAANQHTAYWANPTFAGSFKSSIADANMAAMNEPGKTYRVYLNGNVVTLMYPSSTIKNNPNDFMRATFVGMPLSNIVTSETDAKLKALQNPETLYYMREPGAGAAARYTSYYATKDFANTFKNKSGNMYTMDEARVAIQSPQPDNKPIRYFDSRTGAVSTLVYTPPPAGDAQMQKATAVAQPATVTAIARPASRQPDLLRMQLVCRIVDDTPKTAEEGVMRLKYQSLENTKLVCQIVDSDDKSNKSAKVEGFGNIYNYSAYNFTVMVLVLLLIVLLYRRHSNAE